MVTIKYAIEAPASKTSRWVILFFCALKPCKQKNNLKPSPRLRTKTKGEQGFNSLSDFLSWGFVVIKLYE